MAAAARVDCCLSVHSHSLRSMLIPAACHQKQTKQNMFLRKDISPSLSPESEEPRQKSKQVTLSCTEATQAALFSERNGVLDH